MSTVFTASLQEYLIIPATLHCSEIEMSDKVFCAINQLYAVHSNLVLCVLLINYSALQGHQVGSQKQRGLGSLFSVFFSYPAPRSRSLLPPQSSRLELFPFNCISFDCP